MTTQRVIESIDALSAWVGKEVACSDWLTVAQERINDFAEVTEDRQWIHLDVERAARESPYKATVAHGYLTLSLLPRLIQSCLRVEGVGMSVNYGLNRVRFPAPVLAGQRVRARVSLESVESLARGGVQVAWDATVEIDNGRKPACVAQTLARYYPAREGGK